MMKYIARQRPYIIRSVQKLSVTLLALLQGLGLSSAFMIPQHYDSLIRRSISTSPDNHQPNDVIVYQLPSVEFIDPITHCQVVLLGCFHGTESSSRDVERAITSDTNVVVLELCPTRFSDLQKELRKINEGCDGENFDESRHQRPKPWILAYSQMIVKTIRNRGLPTGLAAAVLGGFSGIQTALSGFTPGLEFTTALKQAQQLECEIILADQDVDETLRRVGSLPHIALNTALSVDRIHQWRRHQDTLVRAVVGESLDASITPTSLPQVQLPLALIRNSAAIQDLVRLTVPPTLFFWGVMYGIAAIAGVDISTTAADAYYETATLSEKISHWLASAVILSIGYLGLALPAVGVVLTERDEILTAGIQAACRRAGPGGRVVAVLGLLHVNGVAKQMLTVPKEHP